MFWDLLFGRQTEQCACTNNQSEPPTYSVPLPVQWSSPTTSNIKPSDAAQWTWTALQCKAWQFSLLTASMDYDPTEAEVLVPRIEGFGPNMYSRDRKSWIELLGYENGMSYLNFNALTITLRRSPMIWTFKNRKFIKAPLTGSP
jgi:hypothetical protein